MRKRYLIAVCAIAMLMGLTVAAGAPNRRTPAMGNRSERVKLVVLSLTFADGQWARVTGVEGRPIRIEQTDRVLTLTPHIVDQESRTVELKVSSAVRGLERDGQPAVESFTVSSDPADLEVIGMSLTVQVKKAGKTLPATQALRQCCVTDCQGNQICGVCVCTPCGVCMAYNWCDCPAPEPVN